MIMYCNGLGPDGKIYCKHMEEAVKRVSSTPKNPNREFYCCNKSQSDKAKCDFWHWADRVPPATESSIPASDSSAAQLQPPGQPSREGNTRPHSMRQPPRQSAPLSALPRTPRSKKRLEDIETGLKQREQDFTPIRPQVGPSKEPEPLIPSSSDRIIPQPPSPVPTEVDCEVETPPRRSFLGLDPEPEPDISTSQVEDKPTTPKKRRLTPPIEGTMVQPAAGAVSSGHRLLLTPPQTTRRTTVPRTVSPMRSRKGKEREDVPAQDQAGPSGDRKEEDALPEFTLPEDTSSTSSVSPTIAENVFDYTEGIKERMKALTDYMESFDITEAAKLLRTIERQKIRYECRDRSQKRRIEELATEKDKLAAEVARLKEELEISEESNRVKETEIARLSGVWDD